jgi:hypothetical protein
MNPEEQLTLFIQRVNEMRSLRLYKQNGGQGGSLNISREVEGPPQVSFRLWGPDEEDLRSFLSLFRQFTLKREPIFVRTIYKLCNRLLEPDDPLREHFTNWKRTWNETAREITEGVQFTGHKVSPEELADLWINGYYFHSDTVKRQRLKEHFPHLTPAQANFQTYVTNATRAIDHLGHLVAEGMHRNAFRW